MISNRYESIVEWAERSIKLPETTAHPGPLRLHEYQKEILMAYQDPSIRRISLMMSSQLGKSTIALLMVAFEIERRKRPLMLVQPRHADIKRFLHDKFEPLLESTPSLRALVSEKRAGKGKGVYNSTNIDYLGGHITLAHAGSPASLRSATAALCIADEVDLYKSTVDTSDPLSVIDQRMVTYGRDGTLVAISTPTTKGQSIIEREYDAGDQRRFWVPCPHCGVSQLLVWENVELTPDIHRAKPWARLLCVECGEGWTDEQRREAVSRGEWRAEGNRGDHASFHLNQLYSPSVTIQQTADSYDPESPRGFWTAVLALPYDTIVTDIRNPSEMSTMLVDENPVERPRAVTCGVDVQQDRLEYQIHYWDDDMSFHIAEHDSIRIGADDLEVWGELRQRIWRHKPDKTFIDRGYRPDWVDKGVHAKMRRLNLSKRVMTARGMGRISFGEPICSPTTKNGYYNIATDEAKAFLSDAIDADKVTIAIKGVPNDFLTQLSSERLERVTTTTGKEVLQWVKVVRRNEALDCCVYAIAARFSLGLDYRRSASASLGSVLGYSSRD